MLNFEKIRKIKSKIMKFVRLKFLKTNHVRKKHENSNGNVL